MSRKTIYNDQKLTLVKGFDHMLGEFLQLYDKDMEDETPEGEGLVLDWSQGFGYETNYTGIGTVSRTPLCVCLEYIKDRDTMLSLKNNFM